jgi:FkbM family methyltransferase
MKSNLIINFLRLIKRKLRSGIRSTRKLLHINYTKISITDNKYKFLVPDDLITFFRKGEYYEQNVIYFFDKIVKSYHNPVMIDVGASCGYYSIRYSNFCKQIFSFEPVSKTYKFLDKNIKINFIKNIKPLKIGLSDSNEEKTINLYNSSANNSIFERKMTKDNSLKKIGVETIILKNLDELVEKREVAVPDIIKADVEGAELQFLNGSKKTISQYRPTVILEYSDKTTKDAGYDREALLDVLELTNYHIYGIPEDVVDFQLIKMEDFNKRSIADIIFIPAELDSYL